MNTRTRNYSDRPDAAPPAAPALPVLEGPVEKRKLAGLPGVRFILAGNAYFTLRSMKTGTRFTYRVAKPEPQEGKPTPDIWFVSLLTGSDNTGDYAYIGMITNTLEFRLTKKSRFRADAPSVLGFAWFWKRFSMQLETPNLEIWHEGRCGRCGRKLTVPESIEAGLGPECAGKVA